MILTGMVLATFAGTSRNQFVDWDDRSEIFGNPHFNPVTFDSLKWNWTHTQLSLYMPVTYMVWGGVAAIAPRDTNGILKPAAFHLLNLALHLSCSILVFFLLRQLCNRDVPAVVGSLVFALHPLQVESVCWASGMYTLLSTGLSIAALIAYIAHTRTAADSSRYFRSILLVIATVSYALALLTKAASVSLPLVAGVIDLLILGRPAMRVIRSMSVWVVLAIPIVYLAKLFQNLTNVPTPPLLGRPVVALDAIGFYLIKIGLPNKLVPDYGRNPDWVMRHLPGVATTVGIAIVALLLASLCRRRATWVTAGIGVFIAGVSPYSGLTTFDFQYVSTVADRYAYFGMLGIAMLACGAAMRELGAMITLGVAIVAWGIVSHRQVPVWHDTDTLFFHTLAVNPRSLISHNVLGYEAAHTGRPVEAELWYRGALDIWPADATIWFNLGNLHLAKSPSQAIGDYQQAIRYLPGNPDFHQNLAAALVQTHHRFEAAKEYQTAIRLDPNNADTHYSLASLLEEFGDPRDALGEYETALRLNPSHKGARVSLLRLRGGK